MKGSEFSVQDSEGLAPLKAETGNLKKMAKEVVALLSCRAKQQLARRGGRHLLL